MLGNMDRPGLAAMTVALPASHARPEIVAFLLHWVMTVRSPM
jgi:hypothetical protein